MIKRFVVMGGDGLGMTLRKSRGGGLAFEHGVLLAVIETGNEQLRLVREELSTIIPCHAFSPGR